MEDKPRNLPSWMVNRKEKQPVQEVNKRPTQFPRKTKRKPEESKTVYCMNEAELVDTAVTILAKGKRCKRGHGGHDAATVQKEPRGKTREKATSGVETEQRGCVQAPPEEQSEYSDPEPIGKNCISKTDQQRLAEEETISYANGFPQDSGCAGLGPLSKLGGHRQSDCVTSKEDATEVVPGSRGGLVGALDDEAFKVLRDIFFT